MALIKCDECGREISDKSVFCPGCGYPTHLNSALKEREENKDDADISPASQPKESPVVPVKPKVERPRMEKPLPLERPKAPKEHHEAEQPETPEMKQQLKEEMKIQERIDETIEQSTEENLDIADYAESELDPEANEKKKVWLFLGVFGVLLVFILMCYFLAEGEDEKGDAPDDTIEAVDSVAPSTAIPAVSDTVAKADTTETKDADKQAKDKVKKAEKKADKAKEKPKEAPAPAAKPAETPAHKAEPAVTPAPAAAPAHSPAPAPTPSPASND